VGLTPTEFFHWAYPATAAPPSEAALKLYEVQKVLAGSTLEVGLPGKAPVRLPFVLLERHWHKLDPATRRDLLETLAEDDRLQDRTAS